MLYLLLIVFFIIIVRADKIGKYFRDKELGWKAYKKSYKEITYSEMIDGKWQSIIVDAHINVGTFEPNFKSETDWLSYPEWAHDRNKIMERVIKRYPLKYEELNEIGSKNN